GPTGDEEAHSDQQNGAREPPDPLLKKLPAILGAPGAAPVPTSELSFRSHVRGAILTSRRRTSDHFARVASMLAPFHAPVPRCLLGQRTIAAARSSSVRGASAR